jgi:hypothetical protein
VDVRTAARPHRAGTGYPPYARWSRGRQRRRLANSVAIGQSEINFLRPATTQEKEPIESMERTEVPPCPARNYALARGGFEAQRIAARR